MLCYGESLCLNITPVDTVFATIENKANSCWRLAVANSIYFVVVPWNRSVPPEPFVSVQAALKKQIGFYFFVLSAKLTFFVCAFNINGDGLTGYPYNAEVVMTVVSWSSDVRWI